MVGDERRAEDFILPACIPLVGSDLLRSENGWLALDVSLVIQIMHVLVAAENLQFFRQCLYACAAVVFHADVTFLGPSGGDDYDTVGSSGTVNRCGRSVFKNFHGLDVGGVDHVDVTWESVDDPQRVIASLDGVGSADSHLHACSRLTVDL